MEETEDVEKSGCDDAVSEDVEKYFETDQEWDNSAPFTPTPSTSSTAQTQSTPNNEKSVAAGKSYSYRSDQSGRGQLWLALL